MNYTTTLEDYINDVKDELSIHRTVQSTEWTDAFIIKKINQARRRFWNRAGYRSREGLVTAATVANTPTVAIPQGIDVIRFVRAYDGSERTLLQYVPYEAYLSRTSTAQAGDPYLWSRLGDTAYFYPAPSFTQAAGMEFFGLIGLTLLAVTTDVDGDIEARWDEMIVAYAVGKCWMKAEQPGLASGYFAIFEKLFKDSEYEIMNAQIGQNIPNESTIGWIPESDERRWGPLT